KARGPFPGDRFANLGETGGCRILRLKTILACPDVIAASLGNRYAKGILKSHSAQCIGHIASAVNRWRIARQTVSRRRSAQGTSVQPLRLEPIALPTCPRRHG